jgi:hypothetical protein
MPNEAVLAARHARVWIHFARARVAEIIPRAIADLFQCLMSAKRKASGSGVFRRVFVVTLRMSVPRQLCGSRCATRIAQVPEQLLCPPELDSSYELSM